MLGGRLLKELGVKAGWRIQDQGDRGSRVVGDVLGNWRVLRRQLLLVVMLCERLEEKVEKFFILGKLMGSWRSLRVGCEISVGVKSYGWEWTRGREE